VLWPNPQPCQLSQLYCWASRSARQTALWSRKIKYIRFMFMYTAQSNVECLVYSVGTISKCHCLYQKEGIQEMQKVLPNSGCLHVKHVLNKRKSAGCVNYVTSVIAILWMDMYCGAEGETTGTVCMRSNSGNGDGGATTNLQRD